MKPGSGARASKKEEGKGPPSSLHAKDLLGAIEHQIIPRLLLAHGRDRETAGCEDARMPPTEAEVAAVARLAVAEEVRELVKRLLQMVSDGLSFQTVLLQVIAPAADWLGERWLDDELTFSEVTVGAGVLERVAAALGEDSEPPLRHGDLIVLMAAPGEQHVLPIHLLGEVLRAEGWAVHVDPRLREEELIELAGNDRIAAVGYTAKDIARLDGFAAMVANVRAASVNEDLPFLVGGSREIALRAPRWGVRYCDSVDDFLAFVGRPRPRRHRESGIHPTSDGAASAEELPAEPSDQAADGGE